MCLSSAYTTKNGVDTLVCDKVTNVLVDEGKVTLTNLLGVDTVVEGILKNIDLNKNIINNLFHCFDNSFIGKQYCSFKFNGSCVFATVRTVYIYSRRYHS